MSEENVQEAMVPEGTEEVRPRATRGPRASKESDAVADLRAEMKAEMERYKAEADAKVAEMRDALRLQLNEERTMLHAQVDAARAEAAEARTRTPGVKPADIGTSTLLVDGPSPSQRRAARPLPSEGIVELELTHGMFLGSTVDGVRGHEQRDAAPAFKDKDGILHEAIDAHLAPARPGDILRFDMKKKSHRESAQRLRDNECAERV